MNICLMSYINSATEETLPMREKTELYQSRHNDVILKDKYFQKAKNANSSKLSKTR